MKTDAQLKDDVLAELAWDPSIRSSDIGVIVKDGVVTLTGHLDSYARKRAAERAAQRVKGVVALATELTVKLPAGRERTDADIAMAAERALEWNVLVPDGRIKVMSGAGWITLTGEVEWEFQRVAADEAVHNLLGVTGVSNLITLTPRFTAIEVGSKIHEALARQADREARRIEVHVDGSQVTLRGNVHSWAERKAAQGAAWSAPGVAAVINNLTVEG
jgi:osmotically-inducible protein OsmY